MNGNSDLSPQAKLAQHRADLEQLWAVAVAPQAESGGQATADPQTVPQPNRPRRLAALLTGWRLGLLAWLTAGDSPRVRQRLTPQGWRWQGFDPWDGQCQTFETEAELRAWLEARYSR